ncbi:MAG: ROK family protein [Candidatus Nanopelagicales bacterium]
MTQVLGIDVGGTKMAVGIVDDSGEVTHSSIVPTPAQGTADDMWQALTSACDQTLDKAGHPELAGVGIGSAGPMVWPAGEVSPVNIPAWRGFPLRTQVQEKFPDLDVRIHNDAIAMTAAEHWVGAGRGYANVLGMVVSTGVGGGLVADNHLINGGLGNAGHIGHIVVDPNGPECRCGGRGCLEAIARGPGTVQWAVNQGWLPGDRPADGRSLAEDANAGDEVAIAAFTRAGEAVGIALASCAALLDLDIAIIGGGMVQSGDLLMVPMQEAFDRHAGLGFARRMKIVTVGLEQEAGIVGAASLVLQGENYWSPPGEQGDRIIA